MILYEKILKELNLLNESASINDVNFSISEMHPAEITYTNENGEKKAEGPRKIYPVAYGISTAGNPVVRAFEEEGDTATRVPSWKLFLISNINSWETVDSETFDASKLVGINKAGRDEQISTLYTVAPIGKVSKSWNEKGGKIDSMPITKGKIDMSGKVSGEDVVNDTIYSTMSPKNVDNSQEREYNNMSQDGKLINAEPETKPVMQKDIPSGHTAVQPGQEETDNTEKMYASDEPIEKTDVEPEEPVGQEIKSSYDDMMNRWNKNEEENGNL